MSDKISTGFNVQSSVTMVTQLLLLSGDNSLETSGSSPESLAQAFSDPDPTTMLVSGSEKDTSWGELSSRELKKTAAREEEEEEEGNGNGVSRGDAALVREFKILSFCYDHGFITRRILERYLLTDMQPRSVIRVVKRMVDKRLLRPRRGSLAERRGIYHLTRHASEQAKASSAFPATAEWRLNERQFDHDEAIIESRIHLMRLLGGRWQSERSLKTAQYAEVPDGILHLESGAKIAIEVECSEKSNSRIERLLERWEESDVSLVLYVCSDDGMAAFVRKRMSRFTGADYLAVTTLGALRSGQIEVWTPCGNKKLPTKEALL